MRKFQFPYEDIRKNSNIIIYGAGDVAKQLLTQIRKTEYCNVVYVLDENYLDKDAFPATVVSPEIVRSIDSDSYDTIFIAISSKEIIEEVRQQLVRLGADEEKILNFDNAVRVYPAYENQGALLEDDGRSTFRIAVVSHGGLGDHLITVLLLKALRHTVPSGLVIDYYTQTIRLFENIPFINHVFENSEYSEENDYDAVLSGGNFFRLESVNLPKAKRISEILYKYFTDMIWHYNNIFPVEDSTASIRFLQYCMILDKNRIEQCNIHGILPLDRHTPTYMEFNTDGYKILSDLALSNANYITICNSVHNLYPNSTKLWPNEYFSELALRIKRNFPQIKIIRIGDSCVHGEIAGVDLDLCGKTTLDELCVLLKYSLLHIGCEGGLIHLNHFLNGKSVCLFGPTIPQLYGYEENINLRCDGDANCRFGCEWVKSDWTEGHCLRSFNSQYSLCMKDLSVEAVYTRIAEYLKSRSSYKYEIERLIEGDAISVLFSKLDDVALINRKKDIEVLRYTDKMKTLIIYDRDLSEESTAEQSPINCLYAKRIENNNISAEYGYLYNLPARNEQYSVVLNFTIADEKCPEYALQELLRIVKSGGVLAVYIPDMEINISNWQDVFSGIGISNLSQFKTARSSVVVIRKEVR